MPLTPAQSATLNTHIKANTNTIGGVQIKDMPNNSDANDAIAQWYSSAASPAFYAYRNTIPIQEIYDKITWANLTPADAPDGTQLWLNRAMQCQAKQFNLQIILQGQQLIDSSKVNVRAGLQDALTNIPSGAGGTTLSGGWVPVRDSLYTTISNVEKLFATGTGSTASPATRVFYGNVSYQDIETARNLG